MADFKVISVVHVLMIQSGQVLLLRRCNTGHDDGYFALPAGKLDGGEPLHLAAIREAREETGVQIDSGQLQMLGVMHIKNPSGGERIDFFFQAKAWSGEPDNKEPGKCDDLRWFDLDKLPEDMLPFVREAMDTYASGEWFLGYGLE